MGRPPPEVRPKRAAAGDSPLRPAPPSNGSRRPLIPARRIRISIPGQHLPEHTGKLSAAGWRASRPARSADQSATATLKASPAAARAAGAFCAFAAGAGRVGPRLGELGAAEQAGAHFRVQFHALGVQHGVSRSQESAQGHQHRSRRVEVRRPGQRAVRVSGDAKEDPKGERWSKWICDGNSIFEYNRQKKQVIEYPLPPESRGKAISDGPLPFLFGAEAQKLKQRYYLHVITPRDVQARSGWRPIRAFRRTPPTSTMPS